MKPWTKAILLSLCLGLSQALWAEPGVTVLNPPPRAFMFALTDQTGKVYDLSAAQGKTILVSFIFTHCAEVCPFVAVKMKEAMALLPGGGKDIVWLALSVDPERDTVPVIAEYSRALGLYERWHFMTGTKSEVADILDKYHVSAEREDAEETMAPMDMSGGGHGPSPAAGLSGPGLALAKKVAAKFAGGYDVSHTATFMVVDGLGRLRATLGAGVSPATLADALRTYGR